MFFLPQHRSGSVAALAAGGGGGGGAAPTTYWNALSYGSRTSSITVTTTASLGGGVIANLVNGGFGNDGTNGLWFSGGQSGKEIKFDFGVGAQKILDGFRWIQSGGGSGHGTWQAEGSNDGSSWTTLSSGFTLAGTQNNQQYTLTNTTAYRYYRLLQTSGTTDSGPWVHEIELRIADITDVGRDAAEAGDRTSTITTTTTATAGVGSSITNLVDGGITDGATDSFSFTNGESSKEIKFDFGSSKIITGLRWLQSLAATHGSWVVEGSPDNSSWTGLASAFTLGSPGPQVVTWTNTTPYRYYRLRQTSGTTSSTPWVQEAEFRIT